jgi:hypothetical protein
VTAKSWDDVEYALQAWAKSVLGSGVRVVWADRSSAEGASFPVVEIRIFGERQIGSDDVEYDANNIPKVTSLWEFTCSLTARVREQTAAKAARNHLMRLKSSLSHLAYSEPLNAAGVAFLGDEAMRPGAGSGSDRVESRAVLDLRMNATFEFYEPSGPAVDMAETATVGVKESTATRVVVELPPES